MFIDSVEKAQEDRKLNVLSYIPDEFRQFFTSPFEQYKERIGQAFTVLGHDTLAEQDLVNDGSNFEDMYVIQFADGEKITAWGHEVCQLNYENCK